MHTVYLSDIIDTVIIKGDDGETSDVILYARVHIDHKNGTVLLKVEVSRSSVHVVCPKNTALEPKLVASPEVLLAARLFGKLL